MSPDDPRHGTEAGFEQHVRDDGDPCDPCHAADILASRRRSKRRTMGHQFTRPIGETLHAQLLELRTKGARLDDIATWSGLTDSQIHRIITGGPEQRVYARTWLALAQMKPGHIVTAVGTRRRLQSLAWLGWSPVAIAERAGLHPDTIVHIRDGGVHSTAATRATLAAVYEELEMTHPPADTAVRRRANGLVRTIARRKNWPPPLAWDDIDDPDEQPYSGTNPRHGDDIDPVAVARTLSGDIPHYTTVAEKRETVRLWLEQGRTLAALERHTGWKVERYTEREAVA